MSTDDQDLTAQRDALAALGVAPERTYVDHGLTGTNRDRPGLREAVPREGMNASDIPIAARSEAGSTSTTKLPPGRTRASPVIPIASTASPVTVIAFGPRRRLPAAQGRPFRS